MASKSTRWEDVTDRREAVDSSFSSWALVWAQRIGRPLVYSSVHLALIAIAEVLIVSQVLSLTLTFAPIVVGLITFTIYANDRLVDLDSDAVSKPRRTAFVRRYRSPLYVSAALSYGLAVALSALAGPLAFGLTLLPGVIWVLYAIDWIPAQLLPFRRLKEVLLLNSILVAMVWATIVVLVPIVFAKAALTPVIGVMWVYFAIVAFVSVEVSNVDDVESDKESDVATMPVVFGVHRTRQALYGTLLLALAVLAFAVVGEYLTMTSAGILSVWVICLLVLVAGVGRVSRENLLDIAAECACLPAFVLGVGPTLIG